MHLEKELLKTLKEINRNLSGIRKALEAQNTYVASKGLEQFENHQKHKIDGAP